MRNTLGRAGILGLVVAAVGLLVIALENLFIAGGLGLVLVGIGLVAYGMISKFMHAMGMSAF